MDAAIAHWDVLALLDLPEVPAEREQNEGAAIRAAQADPAAFEPLYLLYRDRIYLFLLRRTGDPEEAADLTQQVMLRIFRSIGTYSNEKGPFAGWAFAIARNAHRTFLGRRTVPIAWDASPNDIAREDPVLSRSASERLGRFLTRLSTREQELIHLRFEQCLSVREVAVATGIGGEAAKKALQRALKKLKDMYNDDDVSL